MIKINDTIWHPCSVDIIEHNVISIRQFEDFNHYVLKAKRNVGASGRIEVIISENNGVLRFVDFLDEESVAYASGLRDFVEGKYYLNKDEAELEFYENQRVLAWSNKEHKQRLFMEAENWYKQVELLVKNIKERIKSNQSS